MKKILSMPFFVFILILTISITQAQPKIDIKSPKDKVPSDPSIIIGKLDNGMTYYIKENHKPEKRAELMLATKVGSVLEDDDQKGLAHFCEHMAFNGTKDFPKMELVNFLESIGVKFGADLNAFTSYDQTVYMIQLPTDKKDQFEKGFNVLYNWASKVSFDDEEIDKERGVIVEEWRLGKGAEDRVEKKHMKYMFWNSRYYDRDVIGDTAILLRSPHDAFRRFYKDWYRPNMMAIIAVGDFDKNQMEKMIKEKFSGLTNPTNQRERKNYTIPYHKETFISIEKDKELSFPSVQMYFKLPGRPQGDFEDYRKSVISNLFGTMLNNRLKEYTRKPNPPFMFAFANEGRFLSDIRTFMMIGGGSQNITSTFETLITEGFRVLQHGFTQTELDRTKKEVIRNMEKGLAEVDKTESNKYAFEYLRNFTDSESIPGIAYETELYKKWLPEITLNDINALTKDFIKKDNSVICVSAPDKPEVKVPTDKEIMAIYDKVSSSKLEPYIDNVSSTPLISKELKDGSVAKENKIKDLDITEWTLNNGVKVVFKETNFKNDEVVFSAFSPGGSSLVADADYESALMSARVINESGIGKYNANELDKLLTGKVLDVSPTIGQLNEGFRGNFAPEDMETAFQLIYLYFNEAKVDNEAYKAQIDQMMSNIDNSKNSPESNFQDSITVVSTNRHYRTKPWTQDMLKKVDPDKIYDIYYDRFADASDFTFFFVGNLNQDKFKKNVLKYLANLPNKNRKENWKDLNIDYPKGVTVKEVKKGIEKKSSVRLVLANKFDWNYDNRYNFQSMIDVLNIRLREVLREDKGGVYGVGCYAMPSKLPKNEYKIYVMFGCNPDRVDELVKAVMDVMKELQANPPTELYLTKVKETQRREREVNLKENSFWLNYMYQYYWNGDNLNEILLKDKYIDNLQPKDIQNAAKKYLNFDNYMKFVLYPEK